MMRLILAFVMLCSAAVADGPLFSQRIDGPATVTVTPIEAETGNPLPIVASWNVGQNQLADGEDRGYTPDFQLQQLQSGQPWRIAFKWFDNYRVNERALRSWYYEPAWSYCRDNKLPVTFIGWNFADLFRLNPPWSGTAIPADHPFRVNADGSVTKIGSPWSPNTHQWYALGRRVGLNMAAEFAADYPDPPCVLLMDNNELGMDKRADSRQDVRYPQLLKDAFAKLTPSQAQQVERDVYGQAVAFRYAEFKRGLRDSLPDGWKRIRFVGYSSFGSEFGMAELSNDSLRYGVPWAGSGGDGVLQTHDGRTANVGYLHGHTTIMPGLVRSPSLEAGNVRYALDTFREIDPDYFLETHFWNGKNVSRDVWLGQVRCVFWQMRTEWNRLFLASSQTVADTYARDMEPLVTAVTEVHANETLKRFWKHGKLLPNRWTRDFATLPKRNQFDNDTGYGHPYAWMLPTEFADTGKRLFVQHVPLNERLQLQYTDTIYPRYVDRWLRDRSHETPVKVWAVCLQLGDEYLIYAHAPNGAMPGTEIQVCPDGNVPRFSVTVDVPVEGEFWLRAADGSIQAVE